MKIFTVHYKYNKNNSLENVVFIEEAFSFKAAAFNIFWALYNRIWWLSSFLLIFNSSLFFMIDKNYINEYTSYLIQISINILIGFLANDLHRYQLKLNGWSIIDIISSKNKDEAEFRFLSKLSQTNYQYN